MVHTKLLNVFYGLIFSLFSFHVTAKKENGQPPQLSASFINQGLIEAFPAKNKPSGKTYTFEPSAVYQEDEQIILFNDRPLPANFPSQVVAFPKLSLDRENIDFRQVNAIDFPLMNDSKKIEACTQSFDHSIIFASTSFTYFKKEEPEKDKYNRIIYWPEGHREKAKIINPSARKGIVSSMSVRNKITKALRSKTFPKGPSYFKVEGLSYAPDNKLVIGIRSMGNSYNKAAYQYILLEATLLMKSHQLDDQTIEITDVKKIYEMDFSKINLSSLGINESIGISSIEYDQKRKGFFILSSFESKNKIGAFLWFYQKGFQPKLIYNNNNKPLKFNHKAEGLLILDNDQLLVIHDDDREVKTVNTGKSLLKRKLNQGIYSLIQIH